jgi:prevent-host-death family protein
MPHRSTTLRRIASSEVRANLAGLLCDVGDRGERVLIERRGKAAVALVSVDDLLRFQLLEALVGRRNASKPVASSHAAPKQHRARAS